MILIPNQILSTSRLLLLFLLFTISTQILVVATHDFESNISASEDSSRDTLEQMMLELSQFGDVLKSEFPGVEKSLKVQVNHSRTIGADALEVYYQTALKSLKYRSSLSDSTQESTTSPSQATDDSQVTIYIPVDFDVKIQQEETEKSWNKLSNHVKAAYEIIRYTSIAGHADSHFTLAQFHMFGNYSIPSNLTLSLEHYKQFIQLAPSANATAYFHLGVLYSIGGNGEFEVDQSKASLYYQLAFQSADVTTALKINLDIQIAMVLAYRHRQGIATNIDYGKALFYYQYAANKLHLYYEANSPIGGMDLDSYSLRIADFQGGVYGKGVGETVTSLHRSASRYDSLLMNSQNALHLIDDSESDAPLFNELYVNVLIYYEGSYLKPRDFSKAYLYAKYAMDAGLNRLNYLGDLDRRFIAKCIYILGRMYLRGEYVEEDHIESKRLFELSLDIFEFGDTYNDLGLLHKYTTYKDLQNDRLSYQLFRNSSINKSSAGDYNLGVQLLRRVDSKSQQQGVELIANATAHLNLQAVYRHSKLLVTNPELAKGQDVIQLQLRDLIYYVECFDSIISPYLKFGFFELLNGNYETAVTAYSIAAEQGFETAQSSLGYLLYQLPTIGDNEAPKVPESRQIAALTALSRSSAHYNIDSLIYMGDIYTLREEHEKAFNCYQEASRMGSSQAFFNLGWIYENGIGENISRDFHLAKRYYDMALIQGSIFKKESSTNGMGAYLPVQLALLRLRAKRFWGNLVGISNYGLSGQDDQDKVSSGKRSWSDWVSLYRRVHDGGDGTQTGASAQTGNGDEESSFITDIIDQLVPSYEDLALVFFLLVAFGLFFAVNWNQQRQLNRRAPNFQARADIGAGAVAI